MTGCCACRKARQSSCERVEPHRVPAGCEPGTWCVWTPFQCGWRVDCYCRQTSAKPDGSSLAVWSGSLRGRFCFAVADGRQNFLVLDERASRSCAAPWLASSGAAARYSRYNSSVFTHPPAEWPAACDASMRGGRAWSHFPSRCCGAHPPEKVSPATKGDCAKLSAFLLP